MSPAPTGLMARVIKFARSPQGRRAMEQAVRYARSEQGRKQLATARDRAVAMREARRKRVASGAKPKR